MERDYLPPYFHGRRIVRARFQWVGVANALKVPPVPGSPVYYGAACVSRRMLWAAHLEFASTASGRPLVRVWHLRPGARPLPGGHVPPTPRELRWLKSALRRWMRGDRSFQGPDSHEVLVGWPMSGGDGERARGVFRSARPLGNPAAGKRSLARKTGEAGREECPGR
jgi:hypothetical protein